MDDVALSYSAKPLTLSNTIEVSPTRRSHCARRRLRPMRSSSSLRKRETRSLRWGLRAIRSPKDGKSFTHMGAQAHRVGSPGDSLAAQTRNIPSLISGGLLEQWGLLSPPTFASRGVITSANADETRIFRSCSSGRTRIVRQLPRLLAFEVTSERCDRHQQLVSCRLEDSLTILQIQEHGDSGGENLLKRIRVSIASRRSRDSSDITITSNDARGFRAFVIRRNAGRRSNSAPLRPSST